MGRKPSRNTPCPCGSGKTYKRCCLPKGIEWSADRSGRWTRSVPLDDDTRALLEAHVRDLEEAKGAALAPDDLLFPELADMSEAELRRHLAETLRRANVDPAFVYAFEQTGLLVTEETLDRLPDVDREEWLRAVQEYRDRQN